MSRRVRIVIPGLSHHVYQRGHNADAVFRCNHDYRRFLWQARESLADYDVDAHAFTLMTNHYHFIVTPETKSSFLTP